MPRLSHKRLLRVSKAGKSQVGQWKEGVSLHVDSQSTLDQLMRRVCAARWRLATDLYRDASIMGRRPGVSARSSISRFYYAMYHALRACAYIFHGGDDHEKHSDLPLHLPSDLPELARWQNQLKSAREYRNQADYDPYPLTSGATWGPILAAVRADAVAILAVSRAYLRLKGCPL